MIVRRLAALSDRALWLAIAGALFVLSAWPLLLVDLPPLQDLPNHVASAYIAHHPELYPEYVFNGLWKSNSALELWLDLWIRLFGEGALIPAARAFVAIAIAASAIALPWFVLRVAGRREMAVASLLVWPLVHGFCLSMGMLNFALAVPLSLVLLVQLGQQRAAPSLGGAVAIVGLSLVVWYCHPFPLIVVCGLCALDLLPRLLARPQTWQARLAFAVTSLAPLVPVAALVAGTALHHLIKAPGAPPLATAGVEFLTPWELPLHFWLAGAGALTGWGSSAVLPAIALPILAWRGRQRSLAMLGGWPTIALIVGYLGLPFMISNWWYLNTRMVPFVWVAFAVRVPPVLPRRLVAALVAAAIAYSAALGMDYVRLDRDRAEFTAGIAAVPDRATLLPLLFEHGKTSEFTSTLTHAWGYYVLARRTSAPLVFAIERSYALTYRSFPPAALIPPALDLFAERYATPARVCSGLHPLATRPEDCAALWQLSWARFWAQAEPRFTTVLSWAMPDAARALMPPSYRVVFAAGDLAIWQRADGPTAAVGAGR